MTTIKTPAWNNEKVSIDNVDSLYMGKNVRQIEYSSFLTSLQTAMNENKAAGNKPFQDIDFPSPSKDPRRNAEFFEECHQGNPELFEQFIKAKTTSKDIENLDKTISILYDASNNCSKKGIASSSTIMENIDERFSGLSEEATNRIPLNVALKLAFVSKDAFTLSNKEDSEKSDMPEIISKDLLNSDKMEVIKKNGNEGTKSYLDKNIKFSQERYALIDKVKSSVQKNSESQCFTKAPTKDYSANTNKSQKLNIQGIKHER